MAKARFSFLHKLLGPLVGVTLSAWAQPPASLGERSLWDGQFAAQGPSPLSFAEIQELLSGAPAADVTEQKLQTLLTTPFIYKNRALINAPVQARLDEQGEARVRVASWNIERGFEFEKIVPTLDPAWQPAAIAPESVPARDFQEALEQRDWLAKSDIFILSEADVGLNRTGYRNVPLQLAKALGLHAAYVPEFIELAPLLMTPEKIARAQREENSELTRSLTPPDPRRYLGLHGTAVLSRYPILAAAAVRLPECYDWYRGELKKTSLLEKAKRQASDKVFLEDVLTEVRRGSRVALVVDLQVPALPERRVTVVAAHLENRTTPSCRNQQLSVILDHLRAKRNPVILGGDWNTTNSDVSPTSVKKEIRTRLTDPAFLSQTAVSMLVPFGGFIKLGLGTINFAKNFHDPAAANVPLLATNKERAFFLNLRDFAFDDGLGFDLRGEHGNSYAGGHDGLLSNSNQRDFKGFTPTFAFERPLLGGLVGTYKLDWIVVKSYLPARRFDAGVAGTRVFAPRFGRTLNKINDLYGVRLSDHFPISVDLPLPAAPAGGGGTRP